MADTPSMVEQRMLQAQRATLAAAALSDSLGWPDTTLGLRLHAEAMQRSIDRHRTEHGQHHHQRPAVT